MGLDKDKCVSKINTDIIHSVYNKLDQIKWDCPKSKNDNKNNEADDNDDKPKLFF